MYSPRLIDPLKAKLNPICHFLALLGARHILHVSRTRVKFYTANYLEKWRCSSTNRPLSLCVKGSAPSPPQKKVLSMRLGGTDRLPERFGGK